MAKRGRTVEEIWAELNKDPKFRKRQRGRDEKLREAQLEDDRIYAPVLRELARAGFETPSLYELADHYAPLPSEAVKVLLGSLSGLPDDRSKEMVIRQLATVAEPFDGRPLVACFDATSDEALKWAILYVISQTKPHSIDDWLKGARGTWIEETLRRLS
jgi:hypothetical protein